MEREKVIPFPKVCCCDLPAREDTLHLDSYTAALADYIATCPLPMTISLQGSWGSGKSSMMNLLEAALKEQAVCVSFNTWQYAQFDLGEQLPLLFYQSLMEKLGKTEAEKETAQTAKVKDACKRGLMLAARLTASRLGLETELDLTLKAARGDAGEKKVPSLTETIEGLRQSFQTLVAARCAQDGKERAVFFIDDLDRLPPARAVELMEILKTAMECDGCVFVLAIDYEVVIRGVRAKYGSDFGEEKGRSFFDKMIQLPFDLPVEQYRMDDFIRTLIEGLGDPRCVQVLLRNTVHQEVYEYVRDMALLSAGRNPRSLKRLFNSFALLLRVTDHFALKRPGCRLSGSEEYALLFGVACLKNTYPRLYDYLLNVCHRGLELTAFYRWFHEDAAWEAMQLQMPALADSLGLTGQSVSDREAMRAFLRRFFGLPMFREKSAMDGIPPILVAQEDALTDSERYRRSRDGLPFPVEGWKTLEKIMEVSAVHDWPETQDAVTLYRLRLLVVLVRQVVNSYKADGWTTLTPDRLITIYRDLTAEVSAGEDTAYAGYWIDARRQEGIPFDQKNFPESELWDLFERSGIPDFCLYNFRCLLEKALLGEEGDRETFIELMERGTAGWEPEAGVETVEKRSVILRQYFEPPADGQAAVEAAVSAVMDDYLRSIGLIPGGGEE